MATLSKCENARINKELKKLINEYQQNYETIRQISEDKYKTTLQAGDTFYPAKGFYYEEDRQRFQTICDGLKQKARDLIGKAALDVMAQNTAAPSTEALNVLTLMNLRNDVSANEIDQLMTKYGKGCPMVYKALYEKAQSLGYHDFKKHPIEEEAENMEIMASVIDKTFNANSTVNRSMGALIAGFDTAVDQAFPADE